jgi:hypothetical protein
MNEAEEAKRLLSGQSCYNCFIKRCLPLSVLCPLDKDNVFWCKEWAPPNVFGDEIFAPNITTIKQLADVLNMIHSYKGLKPFTDTIVVKPLHGES